MMVIMLEQIDLQPGHRVMETGAARGYNAALMARLVAIVATWSRSILTKILEVPEANFIDQAIAQIAQLGQTNQAVNPA
jgi:protein-L-isoaspartate O-methyltransferase